VDELRAYLETLFGAAPRQEWIELRRRVQDGMVPEFWPVQARETAARRLLGHSRRTDVYVGCAPRTRRSGRHDAIALVHALWVDCDRVGASERAASWDPAPTMIVSSGTEGATHCYWRLHEPVSPHQAETANLRLALSVGADRNCHDAGRILRAPTTLNYKHAPPAPVRLERLATGRLLTLDAVLQNAANLEVAFERHERRPRRDVRTDVLLQIDPPEYVAVLLGATPGRNAKVRCPFHDDERPSLHVYRTADRGWWCYSCRRGGSIYDLAAALWDLETRGRDFLRLRRQLLATFERDQGRAL
jgi:hypothetical protein